jgi:hypothetical protein
MAENTRCGVMVLAMSEENFASVQDLSGKIWD